MPLYLTTKFFIPPWWALSSWLHYQHGLFHHILRYKLEHHVVILAFCLNQVFGIIDLKTCSLQNSALTCMIVIHCSLLMMKISFWLVSGSGWLPFMFIREGFVFILLTRVRPIKVRILNHFLCVLDHGLPTFFIKKETEEDIS